MKRTWLLWHSHCGRELTYVGDFHVTITTGDGDYCTFVDTTPISFDEEPYRIPLTLRWSQITVMSIRAFINIPRHAVSPRKRASSSGGGLPPDECTFQSGFRPFVPGISGGFCQTGCQIIEMLSNANFRIFKTMLPTGEEKNIPAHIRAAALSGDPAKLVSSQNPSSIFPCHHFCDDRKFDYTDPHINPPIKCGTTGGTSYYIRPSLKKCRQLVVGWARLHG